ncbi:MAG: hypothetical protein ACI30V_06030 [Muribaculaceae bacterium]
MLQNTDSKGTKFTSRSQHRRQLCCTLAGGGELFNSRDGLNILDNILKEQSSKGNVGFINTIKKWWENIKEFFGVSPYASEVEKKLADAYKEAIKNKERAEIVGDDSGEYALGDGLTTFKARQERAVAQKGVVVPGLNDAEVKVVDVPRHNFTGTGNEAIASAEKWARENIVGTHSYIHDNAKSFDYEISNKSIKKYLSSTSVGNSENMGVHLAVLTKLPEVISKSIEVEEHPDYSKGADGNRSIEKPVNNKGLIHRFYGSASIDGKVYRVKTTMKEYSNASYSPKAYSYEVTKIELIEAPFTDVDNNSNQMAMTSISSFPVSKLLQNVEKSYDKGKKLLDESRKVDEQIENASEFSVKADEELEKIANNAKADGTYMKAPNGKPSKLDGKQWAQVRTDAFKNWFGDWELANLHNRASTAWNNKDSKGKAVFGLSLKAKTRFKELLGSDTKQLIITDDAIRHIKQKHGEREELRGQKNLTPDDIAIIPYIVNNFDSMELEPKYNDRKGNRAITIKKRINGVSAVATIEKGKEKEFLVTLKSATTRLI